MDAKEYIKWQMAVSRRYVDAATQDLTQELLNWTPPGTANSIGVTLLHIVAGEDTVIQAVIQGKRTIWEVRSWGEKVGVGQPPVGPGSWEAVQKAQLSLLPMLDYMKEARVATDAYLDDLTPEELERKVFFVGQDRLVAEVLAMVLTHSSHHGGEIAALKGVQGCPGLPF